MELAEYRSWASLVGVAILACVPMGYPWIERRLANHLSRILAVAGGVAVGYVTLYLLPKIGDYTTAFVSARPELPELVQYGLYLCFLAGVLVYFFLDRAETQHQPVPVWLHAIAFAAYSFATGIVLADVPRPSYFPYIPAGVALGLHFVGICHQLRDWHPTVFDRYVRWLLGFAALTGWAAGTLGVLHKSALAIIVAFLGGGILVNVLREEWPDKGPGRTIPFLIGIFLFIALFVVVRGFTGSRV